jgi:hypothetical protein
MSAWLDFTVSGCMQPDTESSGRFASISSDSTGQVILLFSQKSNVTSLGLPPAVPLLNTPRRIHLHASTQA